MGERCVDRRRGAREPRATGHGETVGDVESEWSKKSIACEFVAQCRFRRIGGGRRSGLRSGFGRPGRGAIGARAGRESRHGGRPGRRRPGGAAQVSADVDDVTVTARTARGKSAGRAAAGQRRRRKDRRARAYRASAGFRAEGAELRSLVTNPRTSGDGHPRHFGHFRQRRRLRDRRSASSSTMCSTRTSASNGPTSSICSRSRSRAARRARCSARIRPSAPSSSTRSCRPSRRQATFETSFANRDRIIEKLNVTGPIIDDKLAYRVTFFLDKSDGFDQRPGHRRRSAQQ